MAWGGPGWGLFSIKTFDTESYLSSTIGNYLIPGYLIPDQLIDFMDERRIITIAVELSLNALICPV
jgi:hypothetical protein